MVATEADSALAAQAYGALAELGLGNVVIRGSAPAEGDATDAPYDVIVLNGATEILPETLFRQLKDRVTPQ